MTKKMVVINLEDSVTRKEVKKAILFLFRNKAFFALKIKNSLVTGLTKNIIREIEKLPGVKKATLIKEMINLRKKGDFFSFYGL